MLTRSLADAFAVTSLPELCSIYKIMRLCTRSFFFSVYVYVYEYARVCTKLYLCVSLCVSLTMRMYSCVCAVLCVWIESECVHTKRLVRSWSSRDAFARNRKRERVKEKERIIIQDENDSTDRSRETFEVCTFRKLTIELAFAFSSFFFFSNFSVFFFLLVFFLFFIRVCCTQEVYVTNRGVHRLFFGFFLFFSFFLFALIVLFVCRFENVAPGAQRERHDVLENWSRTRECATDMSDVFRTKKKKNTWMEFECTISFGPFPFVLFFLS